MPDFPITIVVERTKGKGRGKKLGIPTFNFKIPKSLNLPYGVYAGYLVTEKVKYKAAIHFGPRPQFQESDPSLEAFILEGNIQTLSDQLELEFISFIRDIQSFPSVSDMLKRIEIDIEAIKKILEK